MPNCSNACNWVLNLASFCREQKGSGRTKHCIRLPFEKQISFLCWYSSNTFSLGDVDIKFGSTDLDEFGTERGTVLLQGLLDLPDNSLDIFPMGFSPVIPDQDLRSPFSRWSLLVCLLFAYSTPVTFWYSDIVRGCCFLWSSWFPSTENGRTAAVFVRLLSQPLGGIRK